MIEDDLPKLRFLTAITAHPRPQCVALAAAMEADAERRLNVPPTFYLPTCSNSMSASASEDKAPVVGFGLGCFFLKSQPNNVHLDSGLTDCLPSTGIGNLRVHLTSCTLAAAISGAAFGLFLTAAKTASAI
jgi:hypothetical protein